MKIIDRMALAIFSIIILVISVVCILVFFNFVNISVVFDIISAGFSHDIGGKVILGTSIVFILFALKCIFYDATSIEGNRTPVVINGENGQVVISSETIENISNSVIMGFAGAKEANSRIYINRNNEITIDTVIFVLPDTLIKDLAANIQTKIKDTIKRTSGLDLKEVNVKIKNIYTKNVTD